MNLYLLTQDINDRYDTYDSVVVAAKNEEDARNIHPSEFVTHVTNGKWHGTYSKSGEEYENEEGAYISWVNHKDINLIKVEFLGNTKKQRGVILASFNAG